MASIGAWRAALASGAYLLVVLPSALASAVVLVPLAVATPVFPRSRAPAGLERWAGWHRRHAARFLGRAPGLDPAPRIGVRRRLRWLLAHVLTGIPFGLVALCAFGAPIAVAQMPLWWLLPADTPVQLLSLPVRDWGTAVLGSVFYVVLGIVLAGIAVPRLAGVHARLTLRSLERPRTEVLDERIDDLTATRVQVLHAHSAELRRIERDLHDSTQARLAAIAMRLGVAREALTADPDTAARLIADAHEGTEEAMVELRDVIRTIYPPVLADRGLAGAVAGLCARSGVPAALDAGPLGVVPAAVEAAAYFVVAECLANTAKHSGAGRAEVRLHRAHDRLRIEVVDDGTGAVDETGGSGITGIRRRAAALDGSVVVDSPAGGPTSVAVELPCG